MLLVQIAMVMAFKDCPSSNEKMMHALEKINQYVRGLDEMYDALTANFCYSDYQNKVISTQLMSEITDLRTTLKGTENQSVDL